MCENVTEVKIGHPVPDFTLNCYDPVANNFPKVNLAEIQEQGKWTILFFYPADFTFV